MNAFTIGALIVIMGLCDVFVVKASIKSKETSVRVANGLFAIIFSYNIYCLFALIKLF